MPNCDTVGFTGDDLLHSFEQCLNMARDLNANVIYYKKEIQCWIFKCQSNKIGTDWNYNWKPEPKNDTTGVTYALPHRYSQRCHNSYLMRQVVDSDSNMMSDCFQIFEHHEVKHLNECMIQACNDKANTFNFYNDGKVRCQTMHCEWNGKLNDYDLKPLIEGKGNVSTYRLSNVSKPCNTLSWNDSVQLPFKMPDCGKSIIYETTKALNQNLETFCKFGANIFQSHLSRVSRIIASKCPSNEEGTEWKYSPTTVDITLLLINL
ncbi:unnamed protein product, partial [Owenia fusiformis]